MVRLPLNKGQLLKHIRESQSNLASLLGREPTPEEILEDLKKRDVKLAKTLDLDTLLVTIEADQKHSSLDLQMGKDDSNATLLDIVWDDDDIFDTDFSSDNRAFYLNKLFSKLSERERYVIKQVYGLSNNGFTRSFGLIADDLEISQEQVRLIHQKAIKRLRLFARNMGMDSSEIFGK